MKAAIYVRVSTDEQAKKGYSLSSQIKECRKRAESIGAVEIIECVDDGQSGQFLDRPGMNMLRELIRNKELNAVICYDPDRFARNLSHQLIVTEEIEQSGATLEFINFDWQNTPEGKLFYSIRGAVSAYEIEKIKERSLRGKRTKAKAGKIVFNTHPYGYVYDKETSSYKINEQEAEMVREIFKWYTEEKLGMMYIAQRLSAYGYPTRTGRRGWSVSTVSGILTNEIYTGTAWAFKTYKKKIGPKQFDRGTRPKEEWVPIPVPPIIDHATFAAARKQAETNNKLSDRNTKYEYLLRGLVECPLCGSRHTLTYSKQGGKKYTYYRCPTGKVNQAFPFGGVTCPTRTIPAEKLEEYFWQHMLKLASDPALINQAVNATGEEDKTQYNSQLKKIISQESKLGQAKEKVLRLLQKDLITEDDAEKELREIRSQLVTLSEERKQVELKINKKEIKQKNTQSIKERLQYLASGLTEFEDKRRAVLDTVEKVIAQRMDSHWSNEGELQLEITVKLKI